MRTTTIAMAMATVAAFGFSAVQGSAATFTLDDFTTAQFVDADPADSSTVFGGGGTGIEATSRDMFVDNTVASVNGTTVGVTSLASGGGFLSFSNDTGARGIGEVTYNDFSLQNDYDQGFFVFNIVPGGFGAFDGFAEFSVNGEDDSGNTVSFDELLDLDFDPILKFSQLTGAAAFDFYNVSFLTFTFDTTNTAGSIDGSITSIDVSMVPLPASALLMLGGLGGLVAMRRRKKA